VLRSPTTLVVGNAPTAQLRADLEMGEAAHARVAAVWGSALPGVLVVPATVDELTAQLQRSSTAGLDQVAGVTNGPLTTGTPATADRVYLNPQALARLTPDGRRVVITHELTHVTVRGTTTQPVPVWLSEGFADYVGYQGVHVPYSRSASELRDAIRHGKLPHALPSDDDFAGGNADLAQVYEQAWLAVSYLASRYGRADLLRLYREVGRAGAPSSALDDALASMWRTDVATVTAGWRRDLTTRLR